MTDTDQIHIPLKNQNCTKVWSAAYGLRFLKLQRAKCDLLLFTDFMFTDQVSGDLHHHADRIFRSCQSLQVAARASFSICAYLLSVSLRDREA